MLREVMMILLLAGLVRSNTQCPDKTCAADVAEPRVAIAMLVYNPDEATLRSFVKYHTTVGIERIFLFFDQYQYARNRGDIAPDSVDPAIALAAEHSSVQVVVCDESFFEARLAVTRTRRLWPGSEYSNDLIVRQMLALEAAVEVATKQHLNWLVHIDIDELLYFDTNHMGDSTLDLRTYFADVPSEVDTIEFPNWEAAPEAEEVADAFQEVTLFKRPASQLADHVIRAHWPYASRFHQYFLSYDQGKSAVRLGGPPVIPGGSHRFTPAMPGQPELRVLRAPHTNAPRVLHYVNCGFAQWRAKIRVAGPISSVDFTRVRDAFFKASQRAGVDDRRAKRFYHQVIMFSDAHEVEALLARGIMDRIRGPKLLLAS